MKFAIKRSRFQEIVSRFSNKQILVIGDVGVDRYTMGSASRLSPEAPVPVVAVTSVRDKLAMAANVAENLQAFGAKASLSSLVGEDRVGNELYSLLEESKISSSALFRHPSRRTTLKERVIAQNQQVVRIDHETSEALNAAAEEFYLGQVRAAFQSVDGVILEDYAKGLLTKRVLRDVIALCEAEKKFVSVDPPTMGTRLPSDYRGVSMLTPNLAEAEKLSGIEIKDDASLQKAGDHLLQEVGAPIVVITQGKLGMTIFTKQDNPLHIPTFARAVFDVSGAGDTVISMLTLAIIAGASIEESAILANFAAGVGVGKPGTATVSLEELEQYMQMHGGLN